MSFDIATIIAAVSGVIALVMSMMVKSARSDKKLAEKERDQAVAKTESIQKRVEAHEKRQEIEQDIALGEQPNTDGMRDPYDRD